MFEFVAGSIDVRLKKSAYDKYGDIDLGFSGDLKMLFEFDVFDDIYDALWNVMDMNFNRVSEFLKNVDKNAISADFYKSDESDGYHESVDLRFECVPESMDVPEYASENVFNITSPGEGDFIVHIVLDVVSDDYEDGDDDDDF